MSFRFAGTSKKSMYRDGTRLFPGIPGNQKSPGILEKVKKFWNSGKSEKILESGKTKTVV